VVFLMNCLLFWGLWFTNGPISYQVETVRYSYTFENEKFDPKFVEIKLIADGKAVLRYQKRDEPEVEQMDFTVTSQTLNRLKNLFDSVNFLNSQESYQANRDLANLGRITLQLEQGERHRRTSFNFTNNQMVMQIVTLFRGLETQQRRVTELTNARQFAPLDLPRLLKAVEEDLKRGRIAEPTQLSTLIDEIAKDDTLPLIARNLAQKILKNLAKEK
jgi:hypothetical protein